MRNEKLLKMVMTALMAALSYVVFTFLQIKITLPGGVGILLIPGSILLPHLPTHLSGQKCAMPQKTGNCI